VAQATRRKLTASPSDSRAEYYDDNLKGVRVRAASASRPRAGPGNTGSPGPALLACNRDVTVTVIITSR
jgi:hypothetical protein